MKKHFLTGLVILLPVTLTVAIVVFLVNFLTQPFLGLIDAVIVKLGLQELMQSAVALQVIHYVSKVLVIIFLFFAIVILGIIARWIIFREILHVGDSILHRIPVVNKVYKTCQEIVKTLLAPKAQSFKQVVMVPFPSEGIYTMGLVVSEAPAACRAGAKEDLITVFIATTPNPTTGFLIMYPRSRCVFLDMKVEEAVKYIISLGVVRQGSPLAEGDIKSAQSI